MTACTYYWLYQILNKLFFFGKREIKFLNRVFHTSVPPRRRVTAHTIDQSSLAWFATCVYPNQKIELQPSHSRTPRCPFWETCSNPLSSPTPKRYVFDYAITNFLDCPLTLLARGWSPRGTRVFARRRVYSWSIRGRRRRRRRRRRGGRRGRRRRASGPIRWIERRVC